MVYYLETSCSSDPLWSARSRVVSDLSEYIIKSSFSRQFKVLLTCRRLDGIGE